MLGGFREGGKFWLNRQVADIESCRVGKRIDGWFRGLLCVVISIASALVLVIGEHVLYEDAMDAGEAETYSAEIVGTRPVEPLNGAFGAHREVEIHT